MAHADGRHNLQSLVKYGVPLSLQGYQLSEYEGQVFLPAIVEQSGHNQVWLSASSWLVLSSAETHHVGTCKLAGPADDAMLSQCLWPDDFARQDVFRLVH